MRVLALAIVACSSASSTPLPSARATPDPPAAAGAHAPARLGDPHNAGHLVTARAIASVDGGAASERPAYARLDQHVTLYALVQVEDAGRRTWYSDAPAVTLGGRALHVSPLARAPELAITWNRIEPAAAAYSNTDENGGNFHFTQIDYVATEIAGAANRAAIAADVRPTLTEDHGHGVGTMRYQIVVAQGDHTVASAGGEARRGRGSGGLTDDVMRVSIRRDDSYLGYLTEMFGQPYIWASAGITDATHQAERLEGADCADFVVYGMRRLGKKIGYTWTGGLPALTRLLAAGTRGDDGVYRDRSGKPVPFTRAGDLALFPRHVAVLVEDRGTIGVLDDQDIVMHALVDTPKQQPLADTGYADQPLEVRRFR